MHPLVSIVTPSYNQEDFLEETMLSVFSQTYPNVEYILVDGGSTDGSRDIIQKYTEHLAWWVCEPDQGQTDAINKGFAHASGEIFAWLNADDLYQPYAIDEAVAFLESHSEIGMVYGDALLIDKEGEHIGKFPARQIDYRRLRRGSVHIPQQATFFRASVWQAVAPLDASFYFAMDYDLWVRIAKRYPIKYLPRLWASFRIHEASKTRQADDRCYPEMLRVHYREGGSVLSLIVLKATLRKLFFAWLPLRVRLWLRGVILNHGLTLI